MRAETSGVFARAFSLPDSVKNKIKVYAAEQVLITTNLFVRELYPGLAQEVVQAGSANRLGARMVDCSHASEKEIPEKTNQGKGEDSKEEDLRGQAEKASREETSREEKSDEGENVHSEADCGS